MRIFFLLFFFCCLTCSVFSLTNSAACPPNEEPVFCINRCDRCEDRKGGCFQILVCTPGCNCKEGFYRNKEGKCIPEVLCDVTCGPNSKPSSCASLCPPTCTNRNPICAEVCVEGCACDPGFIKDDFGNCIPERQCPITACPLPKCLSSCYLDRKHKPCPRCVCPKDTCGPNSKPSNCSSLCPPTCGNRNPICAEVCVDGCVCDTGFIKDDFGNCIHESQCPITECPLINCISGSVLDREHKPCPICVSPTECPLINCISGSVLDRDHKPCPICVSPTDICGPNMVYSDCVDICNDCQTRIEGAACSFIVCNKGCDCRPGYTRNEQRICIPENQCLSEICDPNEVYSDCVNPCNDCQTRNITCNFLVCNKGCDCQPGYTRNDKRMCIQENECPSD